MSAQSYYNRREAILARAEGRDEIDAAAYWIARRCGRRLALLVRLAAVRAAERGESLTEAQVDVLERAAGWLRLLHARPSKATGHRRGPYTLGAAWTERVELAEGPVDWFAEAVEAAGEAASPQARLTVAYQAMARIIVQRPPIPPAPRPVLVLTPPPVTAPKRVRRPGRSVYSRPVHPPRLRAHREAREEWVQLLLPLRYPDSGGAHLARGPPA